MKSFKEYLNMTESWGSDIPWTPVYNDFWDSVWGCGDGDYCCTFGDFVCIFEALLDFFCGGAEHNSCTIEEILELMLYYKIPIPKDWKKRLCLAHPEWCGGKPKPIPPLKPDPKGPTPISQITRPTDFGSELGGGHQSGA